MKTLLKNTPLQTFIVILLAFLMKDIMGTSVANGFYTFSCALKDLLLLFLPIAICIYIATTLAHFEKKGLLLLITLLGFEAASNTSASLAAYGLSFMGGHFFEHSVMDTSQQSLSAYFSLASLRPSFWRVEYGSLMGVLLGLSLPYVKSPVLHGFVRTSREIVDVLLSKGFSKLIPLFVLGFFLNLTQTWSLTLFVKQGGLAIAVLATGLLSYIFILYLLAAGSFKGALEYLKNALPAGVTAFSSMSSVATMPVTIECTKRNLKNPAFAPMLIPATTNIQQIGDCFTNVFLCCVILYFFGVGIPDPLTFMTFLTVFIIARYTTAAVVGGAIFIMLPIYQNYLGFTAEMTALIIAFNMLLDPLVTSTNVMANISLCSLFEKVWLWMNPTPQEPPLEKAQAKGVISY